MMAMRVAGPSPDDWILEDHYDKDTLFLLDRKTSKLFSVPSTNTWPHPVGKYGKKDRGYARCGWRP